MVYRILVVEVFVVLKRARLLSGSKSGDFAQQVFSREMVYGLPYWDNGNDW